MAELEVEMAQAELKAWKALAGYKFMMFGYWAAIWVHLNKVSGLNKPDPFLPVVKLGQEIHEYKTGIAPPAPPPLLPSFLGV